MTTPRIIGCFQRWWRGCLVILLLLATITGGLAYWGYISWCWGQWGWEAELMHYLFDCRCPAASEEARYQPFKVLVSACEHPSLQDISPSGRYALIVIREPSLQLLHIDFETGQEQIVDQGGGYYFINDTLLFARTREGTYIVDLEDGTRTDAIGVDNFSASSLSEQVREALKNAEQAYMVGQHFVALAPDYKRSPDGNVVLAISGQGWQDLEMILAQLQVTYTQVPSPRKTGRVRGAYYSHDGQLFADVDGIHVESTGQLIAPSRQTLNYGFAMQGWVANDQMVIYGDGGYRALLGGGGFTPSYYPLPILLLEVPPEYWPEP